MKRFFGIILAAVFLLGTLLLPVAGIEAKNLYIDEDLLTKEEEEALSELLHQYSIHTGCNLVLLQYSGSRERENSAFFQNYLASVNWPKDTVVIFCNTYDYRYTFSISQTDTSVLSADEMAQLTLSCYQSAKAAGAYDSLSAAVQKVGEKIYANVKAGDVGDRYSASEARENKRSTVLLIVLLAISVAIGVAGAELWTRKELSALAKTASIPKEEWPVSMGTFTTDETARILKSSERRSKVAKR